MSAPADLPAVVAADTVLVEHRLHFPSETEAAWRPVPGSDVDWRRADWPATGLLGGLEFWDS